MSGYGKTDRQRLLREHCDLSVVVDYGTRDVSDGEQEREYLYRRQYLSFYGRPSDAEYLEVIADDDAFADLAERGVAVHRLMRQMVDALFASHDEARAAIATATDVSVPPRPTACERFRAKWERFGGEFMRATTEGAMWMASGDEDADREELFMMLLNTYTHFQKYASCVSAVATQYLRWTLNTATDWEALDAAFGWLMGEKEEVEG
jgi:hypothetical protein